MKSRTWKLRAHGASQKRPQKTTKRPGIPEELLLDTLSPESFVEVVAGEIDAEDYALINAAAGSPL